MIADRVFKALADSKRRKIITLLRKGDLNAGQIASHFQISKPSISEHLKVLKHANIIYSRKRGQYVVYHLNTTVIQDIIHFFMEWKEK